MKYQFSFVFVELVLVLYCGADQQWLDQQIKFRSCNQSSHFYPEDVYCARAIDGNYPMEDCSSKLSHTKNELNAWWSGTLEKKASISKVLIVGTTYALRSNQLNSFKIFLDGGKVCAEFNSSTEALVHGFFSCVGDSKTVKIQATGSSYISLCEISAFGQPIKNNNCPKGYKHDKSGKRCYSEPSPVAMNYCNAQALCKKHGGFLPEFTTKEEIDNFNNFAPDIAFGNLNHGLNGYWLGASRKGKNFYWESNGAKLTVDAFAEEEPNNHKGQENRISLVKNPNRPKHYNKWNDCFSYWKLNVICQSH